MEAQEHPQPVLVAIVGATGTGKTTLATNLSNLLPSSFIIHQDQHYKEDGKFEKVGEFDNWDSPSAIDWDSLLLAISNAKQQKYDYIFIEGNLLFAFSPSEKSAWIQPTDTLSCANNLSKLVDVCFFLEASVETFKARRMSRCTWSQANPEYVDIVVLPYYYSVNEEMLSGKLSDWVISLNAELEASQVADIARERIISHVRQKNQNK